MNAYELIVDSPVTMAITGKFQAPSPDWIHLSRLLLDYELMIMTEGTLYLAGDQQQFTVSKGEYLLLPPLTNQYGYKASACSFYWLHFSLNSETRKVDLSSSLQERTEGRLMIPQQGTLKSLDKIIVMMKQLQDSVRGYNEKTLNNYMATVILCELYNQLSSMSEVPRKKSKQDQLYNDISDYIQYRRHENIKVSEVAEHFGYNEKYLSHLFTSLSGITLKQHMLLQKMEAAKYLLTDTNQNITEVALQLGYKDAHHFMKTFKKHVGLTPTDFRNAYSKRLLFYE
ncbi:AraC family transcriptional regulator [Paenibacillus pinistramenti]|uniref:AraC family transcriptional regulator n=1 Tax=Paenibacillus pinistramenti TaxID=1768003 RepID=UPI0011096DF2|nr:AraC family transcriptional regulator [Paenibacillus pinistramenti]